MSGRVYHMASLHTLWPLSRRLREAPLHREQHVRVGAVEAAGQRADLVGVLVELGGGDGKRVRLVGRDGILSQDKSEYSLKSTACG